MICSPEMRVPVDPLVVSMGAVSATTSTLSSRWPTESFRLTAVSLPTVRRMPLRTRVEKPETVTVTS